MLHVVAVQVLQVAPMPVLAVEPKLLVQAAASVQHGAQFVAIQMGACVSVLHQMSLSRLSD